MVRVDRDILFRSKRGTSKRVVEFWVEISINIYFGMISAKIIRVKCTSACVGNLDQAF